MFFMFAINDVICYGTQGVCTVMGTVKQKIGGAVQEYYVLKPYFEHNASVYVPLNNENLVRKMRPCLTAEEVGRVILLMAQTQGEWIEDDLDRKEQFGKITASGDVYELARMLCNIHLHAVDRKEAGKNLHLADERAQKEAEKLLFDEFAYALGMQPKDILPYLLQQINDIRHSDQ